MIDVAADWTGRGLNEVAVVNPDFLNPAVGDPAAVVGWWGVGSPVHRQAPSSRSISGDSSKVDRCDYSHTVIYRLFLSVQ